MSKIKLLATPIIALLGPFFIPFFGSRDYIPLGAFLFDERFWTCKMSGSFYNLFILELVIYACVVYGVISFYVWLFTRRELSQDRTNIVLSAQKASASLTQPELLVENRTPTEDANKKLASLVKESPSDGQNSK